MYSPKKLIKFFFFFLTKLNYKFPKYCKPYFGFWSFVVKNFIYMILVNYSSGDVV